MGKVLKEVYETILALLDDELRKEPNVTLMRALVRERDEILRSLEDLGSCTSMPPVSETLQNQEEEVPRDIVSTSNSSVNSVYRSTHKGITSYRLPSDKRNEEDTPRMKVTFTCIAFYSEIIQ
jgi:hypothetical protein